MCSRRWMPNDAEGFTVSQGDDLPSNIRIRRRMDTERPSDNEEAVVGWTTG
jgi:hypothetical protein